MGAVVLVVCGVLMLWAGRHQYRVARTPTHWSTLTGRVVDVATKRSNLSGSRRVLHGPTIEYLDTTAGVRRTLPPASYQPRGYRVGEEVLLRQDPASGEVRLPLPSPLTQLALPFVLGGLVIALGVVDLLTG